MAQSGLLVEASHGKDAWKSARPRLGALCVTPCGIKKTPASHADKLASREKVMGIEYVAAISQIQKRPRNNRPMENESYLRFSTPYGVLLLYTQCSKLPFLEPFNAFTLQQFSESRKEICGVVCILVLYHH